MPPTPLEPAVERRLVEVLGPDQVVTDPAVTAGFSTDWTRRFVGATPAVLRPGSTAEVAAVVELCAQWGLALTLQGGNTGLVGGSVPLAGELVLSLTRLQTLGPVDAVSGQVTAGAGVTLARLQAAAAAAGWAYGVDLAARDSATVGGMVATNAGGLRVVRYGPTRGQLAGAEAVLGTGSVVSHLGGLAKDNTGYDLAGLLCGSEGTLGVVTAVRLALVPPTPGRAVALLALASPGAAVTAAGQLRRDLAPLSAAELFVEEGLALVCRVSRLPRPFDRAHPAYLLVEAAAGGDPSAELAEAVDSLAGVAAVAVAVEPEPAARLWRYREDHPRAIATLGIPHKLDVGLPAEGLAEFVAAVPGVVAALRPEAAVWLFGHAADGNLHVNLTGVAPDDQAVDEAVLVLAAGLGGSISAEHGIGTAKKQWLSLNRSPAELAAFGALKAALDPAGILNPGVLLPAR